MGDSAIYHDVMVELPDVTGQTPQPAGAKQNPCCTELKKYKFVCIVAIIAILAILCGVGVGIGIGSALWKSRGKYILFDV